MRRNMFGALGRFFDEVGRANRMVRTYEDLNRLSDTALARHGLSRGDVVREAARRSGF